MKIVAIETELEAKECFPVMRVLRPHLDEDTFLEKFVRQREQGYSLVGCCDDDGEVSALIGYRIVEYMAWGKVLYVDDLITDLEKKQRGYASALLDWVEAKAKHERCDELHLDSGYKRNDAHRLYLKKGFYITSHHFSKKL